MAWLFSDERASRFDDSVQGTQLTERLIVALLALATAVPLGVTGAIAAVFIYQSWQFFQQVPLLAFLTDTQWTPLFTSQQFGIIVLVTATLRVSLIALMVAIPVGLLAAIYLSESAPPSLRSLLRPLLASLSGVPTIVYGYFALLLVTPYLQQWISGLSFFNSLSAGLVTGILITPIVASLSEAALGSVDTAQRRAAYACGFTRFEVIWRILLPEAFPGILASFILAASRALGETMIAAIAAGHLPVLTLNPLVPTETMTGFIVQVSLGTVPTEGLLFHTIFTVGMVLFLITLTLNSVGNWLVHRYIRTREGQALPRADIASPPEETVQPQVPAWLPTLQPAPLSFAPALVRRSWTQWLFDGLGLLAAMVGPAFLGGLTLVTLRLGMTQLNWQLLTGFTSGNPDKAGILAALAGTLWLLALTALFAVPIGLAAAIYLEEYMPKGPWNRLIEINLANATAIPGILYGLLGLAIFAKGLRPLTGGSSILSAALMMTLLVLPFLVTTARSALQQVPAALKRAGYAVGMSRWQVVWHIVLPAARPGLLTSLALMASRVIGETAPLIAIGAVEFVAFVPTPTPAGLRSPFTTLTTQIFFWLSRPQAAFQQKAAAAVIVLGLIVLGLNGLASWLRDRLQKA